MINPHRRHYTAIALGALVSLGLLEGARGVLLPRFIADLALDPVTGATIFSASGIGYFISSSSFGALSRRFGLKRLALTGASLMTVLLSLFLTLREPALLFAVCMVMGAMVPLIELSLSLPVSILYGEQQGGVVNLMHGFFGTGMLSGSLIAAFFIGAGMGWRPTYIVYGLLLVLWVTYFASLPAVPLPAPEPGRNRGGVAMLARDPLVWAATLTLVASVMGEVGVVLWLPSYLQEVKGVAEGASALALTIYSVGFTVARLTASWLVGRIGSIATVVSLATIGAVSLAAMLVLPGSFVWLSALVGAGVATGFATAVSLVATRYPGQVNTVYAIMYGGGGLAGIVTGPLMGWIGARLSLTQAMAVPLAAYVGMILLMTYYGITASRRTAKSAVL